MASVDSAKNDVIKSPYVFEKRSTNLKIEKRCQSVERSLNECLIGINSTVVQLYEFQRCSRVVYKIPDDFQRYNFDVR